MSLQDSPRIDDYAGDLPPDDEGRRRVLSVILVALLAIIVLLLILRAVQIVGVDRLRGTGAIAGVAVDETGAPIVADILVFGTDLTTTAGPDGEFALDGIPAGEQAIIVACGPRATEVRVVVTAGETATLGTVVVPTQMQLDT